MAAMLARVARSISRLSSPVLRSPIEVIFLFAQKMNVQLLFPCIRVLFVVISDGKMLCCKSKKRASCSCEIFWSFVCGKFAVCFTLTQLMLITNYILNFYLILLFLSFSMTNNLLLWSCPDCITSKLWFDIFDCLMSTGKSYHDIVMTWFC